MLRDSIPPPLNPLFPYRGIAANLEVTGRARIWEYLDRGQEPSYVGVTWTQRRDLQREGIREVVFSSPRPSVVK